MDRRELLQRTAAVLGYALSGPTLAAVMDGCASKPALDWTPAFFTPAQAALVSEMAEHLLPKTSTPGAKDVGVDRFIDAIMKDYLSSAEQRAFTDGLAAFDRDCQTLSGAPFGHATPDQRDAIFRKYEAASPPVEATIWGGQISANPPAPVFYRQFKELVLVGYYTSEPVGTRILKYDPIPGRFDGCVPESDIGGAWTLS